MRRRPTLVHRIEFGLLSAGVQLLGVLPERFGYLLMAGLARLWLFAARGRQRLGRANLAQAFPDGLPERELRRILRRSTANSFQNLLDMVHAARHLARGTIAGRIDCSEFEGRLPGPPFLGCTMHLGSWEVAGLAIALSTEEAHAIGRVPKNPLIAAYVRRGRERVGLVLHDRRGGIRPMARALQRGRVGLQVIDQNQRLRGAFVPFFGRVASCERSAATLAVRRGYPLVVGAAVRVGGGFRFRMRVLEPFVAPRGAEVEADVLRTVALLNAAVEDLVREFPDQYLWIHDRYRTRPADEAGPAERST
jgi:KDO2-lipid IV(A) lauroyltransferase